jgi:hypothetical protein
MFIVALKKKIRQKVSKQDLGRAGTIIYYLKIIVLWWQLFNGVSGE